MRRVGLSVVCISLLDWRSRWSSFSHRPVGSELEKTDQLIKSHPEAVLETLDFPCSEHSDLPLISISRSEFEELPIFAATRYP